MEPEPCIEAAGRIELLDTKTHRPRRLPGLFHEPADNRGARAVPAKGLEKRTPVG